MIKPFFEKYKHVTSFKFSKRRVDNSKKVSYCIEHYKNYVRQSITYVCASNFNIVYVNTHILAKNLHSSLLFYKGSYTEHCLYVIGSQVI